MLFELLYNARKIQRKIPQRHAPIKKWDYGCNAPYFVTICTKNREHFFGVISDGEMVLNEMGQIVETEWLKTFDTDYYFKCRINAP